jgi:hypothetical protein
LVDIAVKPREQKWNKSGNFIGNEARFMNVQRPKILAKMHLHSVAVTALPKRGRYLVWVNGGYRISRGNRIAVTHVTKPVAHYCDMAIKVQTKRIHQL